MYIYAYPWNCELYQIFTHTNLGSPQKSNFIIHNSYSTKGGVQCLGFKPSLCNFVVRFIFGRYQSAVYPNRFFSFSLSSASRTLCISSIDLRSLLTAADRRGSNSLTLVKSLTAATGLHAAMFAFALLYRALTLSEQKISSNYLFCNYIHIEVFFGLGENYNFCGQLCFSIRSFSIPVLHNDSFLLLINISIFYAYK